MSFSFNFAGDDIDESIDQSNEPEVVGAQAASVNGRAEQPDLVEVVQHDLQSMLSSLPDRISYSTVQITSPTGKEILLPRRELFDVRVQLMSEDSADNDSTLADLESSDIRTNIYEGGFKTWECSVDLSSLLLDRQQDIDEMSKCDQIVELGAGTALPTLTLFQHCLLNSIPKSFTLSDYNASVLHLVTLPNLLLIWALNAPVPLIDPSTNPTGDLEITPDVLRAFTSALSTAGINLTFLSGPWSPTLASLIPRSASDKTTLILAAETIYSPASTTAFVDLIIQLLTRVETAKAIVAAKRIYFGVGGSVDLMKEMCKAQGAVAAEIEGSGVEGMESGVGRALVEVRMG